MAVCVYPPLSHNVSRVFYTHIHSVLLKKPTGIGGVISISNYPWFMVTSSVEKRNNYGENHWFLLRTCPNIGDDWDFKHQLHMFSELLLPQVCHKWWKHTYISPVYPFMN